MFTGCCEGGAAGGSADSVAGVAGAGGDCVGGGADSMGGGGTAWTGGGADWPAGADCAEGEAAGGGVAAGGGACVCERRTTRRSEAGIELTKRGLEAPPDAQAHADDGEV